MRLSKGGIVSLFFCVKFQMLASDIDNLVLIILGKSIIIRDDKKNKVNI